MLMEIPLILSKLAPSILSSIGKYGLKKFIEEPFLSRAIRSTADRYPDINGLYYSLRDWCVTDSFKEILQEFNKGKTIADEDIVASFIDLGGFYDGECTEQRAKDIIKTFADELYESLTFSQPSQGTALHEKKEEARHQELKELLLQLHPEAPKEKVLLDAKFIRSLSQDDLDFFLTNIFIYHTGRKDVFCYVSKKDEWDALINKFKDYFDFREDKGTYYAHLKDGYAYTILSLIKSNEPTSKRLVEFFAHLLLDEKPYQLHTTLIISFQTMILNLKLLPAEINSLLDHLIKKDEGIESYYAGNITVNMAIALLENIKKIDEQELQWLKKFLMTENSTLRGSIGSEAIKYFNSLPSNMKEILFSFLIPEPNENSISTTSELYIYPGPNFAMRAQIIRALMDAYLELPTEYKTRFDEVVEKIKYEENVYIKKELAIYLLVYKSADFKFYSLLDYLLVDDNTISQVVGSTGLGFLETKGKDKYEYMLNKIKEIKDENLRYQKLVENYFALDERDRGMVEEHVKKHSDAYNAQRFANIIGEHINPDNEDYMMTLEKFVALSKAKSKATIIGVILGIVFNCKNIPRSIREEILYRYADTEDYNIREQIIRAVLENWTQFSDAIHEVVFEIIKKIDYRGCYLKHNCEAITEPFKAGLKPYLAPQEEMVK